MSDDIQERWIEVNDNDLSNPNLTYSGNWFVDSYDQPLEPSRRAIGGLSSGTAHGTNTTGGLAFTFIGALCFAAPEVRVDLTPTFRLKEGKLISGVSQALHHLPRQL